MKFRLAPGLVLIAAVTFGATACSSIHAPNIWPFHKKPKPVPEAVNELSLVNADGSQASFPQYWKRNTLVIDLSGVGGSGMGASGNVAARLPDDTTWPVRVAVRVRPGSVGQIEVKGEERSVMAVSTEGTLPIDLELAPSVYTPKTAAIYIAWGPQPVAVETAPPMEATPEFVSPTEVPKPAAGATPEENAPSASEIIPPAEAAQPSPPPGS